MLIKQRSEPLELTILKTLNARSLLNATDSVHFHNLEKGYRGEIMFDEYMKEVSNENNLILNDLLLEYKNTVFQIDSLFQFSNTLHLFEVKNFEGDFIIDDEKWYSIGIMRKEIKNPLLQLKRTESLLRQLLQELGSPFPIEAHLVFINPNFHLYKAPADHPIIYPSQLSRFREKLKSRSPVLKASHRKLAKQLLSLHMEDNPYARIPEYRYEGLEKGIVCPGCQGFYGAGSFKMPHLICNGCGVVEPYETAVLRSVAEIRMLFPGVKITTNLVFEWCGVFKSKKTIWKILAKNFKRVNQGKVSYYIDSN
ncbi:NERD domain-containing protein [Bacillus tianshenii]|uniref:nuclease-related domain-containing protein n=1 Tax=Sutcliffiella tianshenii TaxID=1463404 RepID=UPI001CD7CEDB|nr:nuclease-related domain-containing protein [Bacillus tianshenii]MCA1318623.1 NERD domain-containing protein [Bacillus tianshenii]